jgi:UDP-glucuronate 4-epimerase
VLVTGAAGFIGFHVTLRLLQSGRRVVGLDNLNDYYDPKLKRDRVAEIFKAVDGIEDAHNDGRPVKRPRQSRFTFVEGDIAVLATLEELFRAHHFEEVVHLAAQAGVRYSLTNPHTYVQSNIVGFTNVLECCRHHSVKHLVYASSSSVYGGNVKTPFSEDDTVDHPVSLYAASKKANELFAHTYSHLFGLLHSLRSLGSTRHGGGAIHGQNPSRRSHPVVQLRQYEKGLHVRR